MSTAVVTPANRFRFEVDLVDALETTFANSVFRRNDPSVTTFREVPAVRGVPDLTAVRFDHGVVADRQANGVRCLSTDLEVRVVLALTDGPLELSDLTARVASSRDYVKRSLVPLLIQLGWLEDDRSILRLRPSAKLAGRRVVTVEAKLRDWLRAFNQARHQQLSADAAYIALDAANARGAQNQLSEIVVRGIGVLVVDANTGRHKVLARPRRVMSQEKTRVGRTLIAERSLELLLRGQRAGQVAPVFGWFPPEGRSA